MLILAINPGSTSTKVALYREREPVKEETIRHSVAETGAHDGILAQKDMRKQYIRDFMAGTVAAVPYAPVSPVCSPPDAPIWNIRTAGCWNCTAG